MKRFNRAEPRDAGKWNRETYDMMTARTDWESGGGNAA